MKTCDIASMRDVFDISSERFTKRETIAMNAMNAIIVNGGHNVPACGATAKMAIRFADALLEEIEK